MRTIIPYTAFTRTAVAVLASVCVLSLFKAATAHDDLGLHRFWTDQMPTAAVNDRAATAPPPPRTATAVRPLRVALLKSHDGRLVRYRQQGFVLAKTTRPRLLKLPIPTKPAFVLLTKATPTRLLSLPIPTKPAIVSIYEDRTLRNGDAVMLVDGIHVFRGDTAGLHRPHDFVRLPLVASIDWKLRQTLNDLDRNPPTRWTSLMTTPG